MRHARTALLRLSTLTATPAVETNGLPTALNIFLPIGVRFSRARFEMNHSGLIALIVLCPAGLIIMIDLKSVGSCFQTFMQG